MKPYLGIPLHFPRFQNFFSTPFFCISSCNCCKMRTSARLFAHHTWISGISAVSTPVFYYALVPEVIMRSAKILSLFVEMFNIKFIDSLTFIPMRLADFPKTFGIDELAKGYFPHLFNKKENENYVGPIPPSPYYNPNGMSPKEKEKFLEWHNG